MKHAFKKTMLVLAALFCSACAGLSIDLTEKGKSVQLERSLTDQQKAELTQVTTIKCELGRNAKPFENNFKACENDLRNRASSDGDVLLIQSAKRIKQEVKCNNCVEVVGVVYRNRNAPKHAENEAQAHKAKQPSKTSAEKDDDSDDSTTSGLSLPSADDLPLDTPSANPPSLDTPRRPTSNSSPSQKSTNQELDSPTQQTQPNNQAPKNQGQPKSKPNKGPKPKSNP